MGKEPNLLPSLTRQNELLIDPGGNFVLVKNQLVGNKDSMAACLPYLVSMHPLDSGSVLCASRKT